MADSAVLGCAAITALAVALARGRERCLSLRRRLTIILTTSPVRLHPSTALLDETVASMRAFARGAHRCELLVVCDGVRTHTGDGREYAAPKWRQGIVDSAAHRDYAAYKARVRAKYRVLELPHRHGFGHAVRAALRHVRTPFVLVMQHDRNFRRPVDVESCVAAMARAETTAGAGAGAGAAAAAAGAGHEGSARVCYLGLPTSTTMKHRYHVLSKYALKLPGPCPLAPGSSLSAQMLISFFDSAHIASTRWYRDVVFCEGKARAKRGAAGKMRAIGADRDIGPYTNVAAGGFIEDKFGQRMLRDIRENGLAAHAKYNTFVLVDERARGTQPQPAIGHLDGRDDRCAEKFVFTRADARKQEK